MQELFYQLGVDWKLLLSQSVNFLLLLAVLTFLFYRPLLKMMKERREKIEMGMKGAKEAEKIIVQAQTIKEKKIASAEASAVNIIKKAESEAGKVKEGILVEAREKSDTILKEAADVAQRREREELARLLVQAKSLVKEAIVKAVSLKPEQVDEKLISQALNKIKEEKGL